MPKLPTFKSEQEERDFWLTHDSTDYFDKMEDVTMTPKEARANIRFYEKKLKEIEELSEIVKKYDCDGAEFVKDHFRHSRQVCLDSIEAIKKFMKKKD